ncbi:MAG: urea amidolyase family protein, partial [Acidobacteria bacterium]|nr:urea amidolyase family protein [Acidobacteriota bacterium]
MCRLTSRTINQQRAIVMEIDVRTAGDLAVRLTLGEIETRTLAAMAEEARAREEIAAAVPAAESILLIFRDGMDAAARQRAIESISGGSAPIVVPRAHQLEVSFAGEDAPDLSRLLDQAGLDRATFLASVAALSLRVRFLGFRPGFAYLEGVPEAWRLPRLETPRPRVPAGSFALAGAMAGFYPEESPGGWNLIGRSAASFWDSGRATPNLLSPGDEVRVIPVARVERTLAATPMASAGSANPIAIVARPATAMAVILPSDPRRFRFGLPPGGAFDRDAAEAANHNVGNESGAGVLECALSGPVLRVLAPAELSWCGGDGHLAVGGERVADVRRFVVDRGDELEIGGIGPGARGYLAVRGGFAASRQTALPAMLHRGDVLGGEDGRIGAARFRTLDRATPVEIDAIAGPDPIREEWRALLEREVWEVTPRSDRAGVR